MTDDPYFEKVPGQDKRRPKSRIRRPGTRGVELGFKVSDFR